jgi:hypothetical protein
VLAVTANPRGYASCLVSLLEKSLAHRLAEGQWSMAQAAVHRAREAALRLAQILDKNRPAATRVWKPALVMLGAFSVVCLAALPVAPKFIAFEQPAIAGASVAARNAEVTIAKKTFVEPVAVATSSHPLPVGRSSSPHHGGNSQNKALLIRTSSKGMTAKAVQPHTGDEDDRIPPRLIAAQFNELVPEQHSTNGLQEDQVAAPAFQTLVFVEATRYGSSGVSVWSVQVWQVTLVSGVRERLARVPAAKSI